MAQRSPSGMLSAVALQLDSDGRGPLVPALGASIHWLEPQERRFGARPQLIHLNGELTGRFPVWQSRHRYGIPLQLGWINLPQIVVARMVSCMPCIVPLTQEEGRS